MISNLSSAQRFMYEYGCFVSFWGNFDLLMEALICRFEAANPIANCQEVNQLTSGRKRDRLHPLLNKNIPEAALALGRVFDVAERNDWVHGVVLNPCGDFSTLTRFRVKKKPFKVENTPIDLGSSQFAEFYDAALAFERVVERFLHVSATDLGNAYLTAVQAGQSPSQ